ncbi:hypothetical protein [Streptomyces sp. NBC_00887]|uniref:hypothetical protein n=1 Tax=Streptomyces sp. NBC_00887 TaxID=2975859 RepID=UPI003868AD5A|nr:hypothetical protein OG844_06570 [Streptomyces sp. NBC_00887]WSY35282.1 hypothetical protein OG844_39030 [Streptomyces sp. NBC_00887]
MRALSSAYGPGGEAEPLMGLAVTAIRADAPPVVVTRPYWAGRVADERHPVSA